MAWMGLDRSHTPQDLLHLERLGGVKDPQMPLMIDLKTGKIGLPIRLPVDNDGLLHRFMLSLVVLSLEPGKAWRPQVRRPRPYHSRSTKQRGARHLQAIRSE